MTHPSKRFLIFIPIIFSLLLFATYSGIFIYTFLWGNAEKLLESTSRFVAVSDPLSILTILLVQAGFGAVSILVLFLFFRKTHSSEVFFFMFGLFGFVIQTSRFFMAPASMVTISSYSLLPFTRLVYFGRLFTILCFFASGLFATGFTNQKRNFYLSLVLLVTFVMTTIMPVDFTSIELPLLFDTGGETGFTLAYYAFAGFTVLNFLLASYKHSERNYVYVGAAIFLVIAGVELSFYFPYGIGAAAGLFLMAGGTYLFAERSHEIHLWV
ncbi:MAG: hypothetical protein ACLFNZ_09635 [Spirochaetaceae bacterium]